MSQWRIFLFILEINIWGIRRRTGKSRSLFPGFLFSLKRSSIARTVIETAGDLLTTSARGRRYKSRRQTYLAAATATTLVWKQLRVSLPPNPPPKEHKKETMHESRKRTRKTCPRGSAYGRLQSTLSHKNYRLQDDGNSIKPKTHPFF